MATAELIQKIPYNTKKAEKSIRNHNNKIPRRDWITKGNIISFEHKEFLFDLWDLGRINLKLKSEYNKYESFLNK